MRKLLVLTAVLVGLASLIHPATPMFPINLPWNDSSNTAIDLSSFIYRNINNEGFVTTTPDGHFAVNSGRIKFWGTNTTFEGNFPSKSNAPGVAARLAKYGFNIVRFHHMDMFSIWTTTNPDRVINPTKLDLMDYFIWELKKKGIYTNINLLVSRPFNQGTDLPSDINLISDWKVRDTLGFFDPQTRQLQKDFARDLLTHVNPYTGNAYINEPAIAFIEINNETGLTHAYLSSQLDPLPPHYYGLLNTQWNDWLKNKYATHAALQTAWGAVNQPLGAEMLSNWNFAAGTLASWSAEMHGGAVITTAVETATAPGGLNAARINVTTAGTQGWHVQFNQPGLSVTTGVPYTVTFYARADSNRTVELSLMMADGTYSNLGFSAQLNLTTSWQLFTYTFTPNQNYPNARINFGGMGLAAGGSFYFAGVSMRQGGLLGLTEGEELYAGGISNFIHTGGPARTAEGRKDWFRFLQETEEEYWTDMRDYVVTTLGANPIVFGTIVGCSTPNVQSVYDAIDTHSYWEHPQFPGTPWDPVNWLLYNRAMVNSQASSTIGSLGVKAVLNKPLLVTEYNHPHPNSYESEAYFFLSAYGSLQDWDAVFPFDYNSSDSWNTQRIESYFTTSQNPVKMASIIPAALAFYRGDIKPANQTVVVPINKEDEIDELLTGRAWQLVDAEKTGESQKTTYIHKMRIAVEGQSVPGGSLAPGSTNTTGDVMVSDTGEITWDASVTNAGFIKVDTEMTKMVWGFHGGRTYYLSGVTITPGTTVTGTFSSIALSALDGDSFESAQRILVTALGTQYNTGAQLYQYPNTPISFPPAINLGITLRNQWGTSPTLVEGIPAQFILPCDYNETTVWALDNTGARKVTVTVTNSGGFAAFGISPGYESLWYEVVVNHPEYTPTVTSTVTPFFTPTITPTVTMTSTPVLGDILDDCEATGSNMNLWGGWWYSYSDTGTTINAAKEYPGGPVTGNGAYRAQGTISAGGYAGAGSNLAPGNVEIDMTAYEGVRLYIKGNGAVVHVAIVTGNFTDVNAYNNWEYSIVTTSSWTLVQIPFSAMTQPYAPALDFDLTRAKDIQFKLSPAGAFDIYLDDIEFYYPAPNTPTVTQTASPSPSVTATNTDTGTPTLTVTMTATPSVTATVTETSTPTQTATVTETFTITETATITETHTVSPTVTPTVTGTPPTLTVTPTVTESASLTVTLTPTFTITETETPTYTHTQTVTQTITETITQTLQSTATATPTATRTATPTPTRTRTVAPTATRTPTPAVTPTQTPVPESSVLSITLAESYPNPVIGPVGANVKFDYWLTKTSDSVKITIYTGSYRKVMEKKIPGPVPAGRSSAFADVSGFAPGIYYWQAEADSGGQKARSKPQVMVVLK